jgi:hypothetical protein
MAFLDKGGRTLGGLAHNENREAVDLYLFGEFPTNRAVAKRSFNVVGRVLRQLDAPAAFLTDLTSHNNHP